MSTNYSIPLVYVIYARMWSILQSNDEVIYYFMPIIIVLNIYSIMLCHYTYNQTRQCYSYITYYIVFIIVGFDVWFHWYLSIGIGFVYHHSIYCYNYIHFQSTFMSFITNFILLLKTFTDCIVIAIGFNHGLVHGIIYHWFIQLWYFDPVPYQNQQFTI